ncbi:hypothetical protein Q4574_06250 [Aliiglaciecola sp. 3_MG-2023]|uniref:hypothetical protein n=1 Tax=Aliiglaciecola sp. 3_MG-2023 TaxID=3062644 RepID=UPI0026E40D55|nr:hypothetical protein [Aliiglaciecola sp. 3_MG-2023]MDO6692877.1 hypothetical protein [Aliiglaciecola sp. 3_MG-2023]
MQINTQPLSLFDYLDNQTQGNQDLENIANTAKQDIKSGLAVLDSGLANQEFEETLRLLEKGEIDLDLNTVENYYQFNQNRLNQEIEQLFAQFDSVDNLQISIENERLTVTGDEQSAESLQKYLDRDSRLNSLVKQTSTLSQFVEWGKAKEQAAVYQEENMPEETLVDYLKEAREVVNNSNELVISSKGGYFTSHGQTDVLTKKYSESED